MFLFTLLTLLTFINSYASRIISLVLNTIQHDKSVGKISSEILELKKELNLISMVDEFAKHARLQRKIIKLQEEKKSLIEKNAARAASLKLTALQIVYGITTISLLSLIYLYKGEAIAQLHPDLLWPVPNIFSWFSGASGCISIPSWVVISSAASRIIARNY